MKQAKPNSKKNAAPNSSAKAEDENAKHASTDSSPASEAAAEKPEAAREDASPGSRTPESSAPSPPVVSEQPELPSAHGKIGVFGGPKDRGIKAEDKLALPTGPHGVYERVRSLNPKSFYCAMRWNYHVQHLTPEEVKRWWANKKLLITNAKNGKAVVARAVDYGPHENTGLDIALSPGAAEALGVEIGDEVDIALTDPKSLLGPQ